MHLIIHVFLRFNCELSCCKSDYEFFFSVVQSYKPGYTAPPQVHHDETTIEIRLVSSFMKNLLSYPSTFVNKFLSEYKIIPKHNS
jgi:hypothetical protein